MRQTRIIAAVTVGLGIVSLVCLVGCFMALQDIYHDYASPEVLRNHPGIAAESLPRWTTCDLEWGVIRLGFLPMLLFHVAFLVSRLRRRGDTSDRAPRPATAAPGS
jgi:hypothetical protein